MTAILTVADLALEASAIVVSVHVFPPQVAFGKLIFSWTPAAALLRREQSVLNCYCIRWPLTPTALQNVEELLTERLVAGTFFRYLSGPIENVPLTS